MHNGSEAKLSAIIHWLFDDDFSSIVATNTGVYSQPSTCLIYIYLCVGWGCGAEVGMWVGVGVWVLRQSLKLHNSPLSLPFLNCCI